MLWSTILFLLSQMYRGLGRRRYLMRGLWLAGPVLSILAVGLLASTFGKSNLLFALGMTPLAICWLLAIVLPHKWIKERRRSEDEKHQPP
jgi:MFS family permease